MEFVVILKDGLITNTTAISKKKRSTEPLPSVVIYCVSGVCVMSLCSLLAIYTRYCTLEKEVGMQYKLLKHLKNGDALQEGLPSEPIPGSGTNVNYRTERDADTLVMTHMQGGNAISRQDNRTVLWESDDCYNLQPVFEVQDDKNLTKFITIREDGYYLVYAQIHVYGRHQNVTFNPSDPYPGFEIVRNSPLSTGRTNVTTLSQFIITQDQYGSEIFSRPTGSVPKFPNDALSQMGVHYFWERESISVRVINDNKRFTYDTKSNNAYFGLIKL